MDSTTLQLEIWLRQILDHDAQIFEDAYWGLRPDPVIVVPRLLQLLEITHDAYSRGKILELLGESGDPSVASVISADLHHADQRVREWAELALAALNLGTPWQHGPE